MLAMLSGYINRLPRTPSKKCTIIIINIMGSLSQRPSAKEGQEVMQLEILSAGSRFGDTDKL
jgi:hypothetical protein